MSTRSKVIAVLLATAGGLLVYKASVDLATIALAARAVTDASASPPRRVPPARPRPAPAPRVAPAPRQRSAIPAMATKDPAASVAAPMAAANGQPPADAPAGLSVSDLNARIRPTDEHRYDVDRTFLEQLFERGGEHLTRVDVAPIEEDDRIVGVSLHNIQPSGLLAALGLQDGDAVRSINGRQVLGKEELLDAYARFKHDERVTVALVREHETLLFEYDMR